MSRPSFRLLGHGAPTVPVQYTPWSSAVVAVGQSKFGEAWDGADLALNDYITIDRETEITARLKVQHADLFQKAERLSNIRRLFGGKAPVEGESSLLAELRSARQSISDTMPSYLALATQNSARKAKLAAAQDALFDDMLNSRISSFWYKQGSPALPAPLPTGRLVAAQDKSRLNLFASGRIRLNDETWHVYVDTAELAKLYPPLTVAKDEASALDLPHLSPHLRLMIHVARLRQVAPGSQPTVDELEALCREHAPAFGLKFREKSERPKYMARFIRDPIS